MRSPGCDPRPHTDRMPELPELQAHAERLDSRYAGITLERFTPLTFTALNTAVPPASDPHGHNLVFVGRRGKHILLDFGELTFVVHLMQHGRLKEEPPGKQPAKPKTGVARWMFKDGRSLLLTEAGTERRAGVWAIGGDPETQPPLDGLGPEADAVDPVLLLKLLHGHPMRLHGWLRDQRIIAGLGRRLANEICHRARISPFASTGKLTADDAAAIVEAIQACINESLAYERGGDDVRAVEYRSYTIDYCPACQTGGKILADNTTSKFLK